MSKELLTTGQMIDSLKVGEIAECVNAPSISGMKKDASYQVEKVESGHIKWCDGQREVLRLAKFIVDEANWRIIPKYVSFEEAKKAYEDGKDIRCHYINKNGEKINFLTNNELTWKDTLQLMPIGMIFTFKWTIED